MDLKKEINSVLRYLNSIHIHIDSNEFKFQIESHPDSPSLLAFSDALNFFGINNWAFKLDFNDIQNLPDHFLTILKEEESGSVLYFSHVEVKNDCFVGTDNNGKKKKIYKEDLKHLWYGIVLLAEKEEFNKRSESLNKLFIIFAILLVWPFIYLKFGSLALLFLITIIIGIYFSIEALKIELGFDSAVSKKFCSIMENADCSQIIKSNKSIFGKFKLSDFSIGLFCFQLTSLFLFNVDYSNNLFSILLILASMTVPITLYSIYFQRFVERKWCPICLAIISTIYLQLILLIVTYKSFFTIENINLYIVYVAVIAITVPAISYYGFKKLLINLRSAKESSILSLKYLRNYQYFKRILKNNKRLEFKETGIVIGDKNANNIITIITSPLCSFCKETHYNLHQIYDKYKEGLKIEVRLNLPYTEDNKLKELYLQLYNNYLQKGEFLFMKALHEWFEYKDIDEWLRNYSLPIINQNELELNMLKVNNENHKLGQTFTPNLFINNYEYPALDRKFLELFIDELISDKNF